LSLEDCRYRSFTYKYTIDTIMRNYFLRDSPSRDCKLFIRNTKNTPYLRSDYGALYTHVASHRTPK